MNNKWNTEYGKKKFKLIISLILTLIIAVSFLGGFFAAQWSKDDASKDLNRLFQIADKHYYGEVEITTEELANVLVREAFDEYSAYYSEETYKKIQENAKGKYKGVGLSFLNARAEAMVHSVSVNSPAHKAGIKPGDILHAGKNKQREEWWFYTKEDAFEFFNNTDEEETFTLYVERDGEFTYQPFELQIAEYTTTYVEYYDSEKCMKFLSETEGEDPVPTVTDNNGTEVPVTEQDVAYIKIYAFEGNMVEEFVSALDYMEERGRTKLILDLRDNGGGQMDIFLELARYLVNSEKTKTPVATYVKEKGNVYRHFQTEESKFPEFVTAISVLANERTASASEALIGAMITHKTITKDQLVIERNSLGIAKTYGKGVMQTTYKLPSGGALKITTAKLYWPDMKTCIDDIGIKTTEENSVWKGETALLHAETLLKNYQQSN